MQPQPPEDEVVTPPKSDVSELQTSMDEVAKVQEQEEERRPQDPKLLRPRLQESETEMKEKWEVMKLWFEISFPVDQRADVIVEIEKIINYPEDKLARMNMGQLIYTETKLVQYMLPLGSLVADLVGKYNFSYMYRKFQYANVWTKQKDAIIMDGVRITNGEVDQLAEIDVWKERCIEVFMQRRSDEYQAIMDASQRYLNALRSRIKLKELEDRQSQERRIYGENKRG